MAVTRDLWLVLRARDEASRIVRSFAFNLSGASAQATQDLTNFQRTIDHVATRLDQFGRVAMLSGTILAGLGAVGIMAVKNVTEVAVEYDKAVRRTFTQVDNLKISLQDIADVGLKVAKQVGVPFEQFQETLFFIFSSIDVGVKDAESLLRGFAKEAVAGNTQIENAAKSNIAVMNALGLTTKDLGHIQDVMFQTVRKGIITYEELASVIGRALPATARAGQSFETLSSMIAFLTRNGLSAAMAATSAARALESFAHPTTVKRLGEIGIKVKDARGEFLPLVDVMSQLNNKLKEMTQPQRAAFFQELFKGAGGTIQARRFWDLAFKNFDDFTAMLDNMKNSTGVFEEAYKTMAGSVAVKSELLNNKWTAIKQTIGEALIPHLLKLLVYIEKALDWFDRLNPSLKSIIGPMLLWGSVIAVIVGVLTILIGTIGFFVAGILAGGTALLGIIAAMAAVVVGIAAIGTAFYIAWQRSENFRKSINQFGNLVASVWSILVAKAKEVKSSFEENILPTMRNLHRLIDEKILPVIQEFVRIWQSSVVPRIKEAANIISDVLNVTFKVIAHTVNNYLIPAIRELVEWWQDNKEAIQPFLTVLGQAVKWILILTAVLLALGLASVVVAITAVVGALLILLKILSAIKDALSSVASFFMSMFNMIVNVIGEVSGRIASFFAPIINSIKNFFKELFGLIVDMTMLIVAIFKELNKDIIEAIVLPIVNALIKIRDFFVKIFLEIYNVAIKPVLDRIRRFWDENFGGMQNTVVNTMKNVVKFIMDKIGELRDLFKNANTWLINAGRDIIRGLIDGITDKIKELREKLKEITNSVPNWKGPKTVDLKLLVPVGQNIMRGFMEGIASQIPALEKQLQGITLGIGQLPTPTYVSAPPGAATVPSEKNIHQYITVNTQEIDPRIHAIELGYELGNRL